MIRGVVPGIIIGVGHIMVIIHIMVEDMVAITPVEERVMFLLKKEYTNHVAALLHQCAREEVLLIQEAVHRIQEAAHRIIQPDLAILRMYQVQPEQHILMKVHA